MRKLKNYFRIVLSVWLLAVSIPVEGQQTNKIPRVGYLSGTAASPNDAFLEGLRDLGYAEGKNITIEFRTAQANVDHLPQLATNLFATATLPEARSALTNTFGGIVKPIFLAAFTFTLNSNFFGCSTGKSK